MVSLIFGKVLITSSSTRSDQYDSLILKTIPGKEKYCKEYIIFLVLKIQKLLDLSGKHPDTKRSYSQIGWINILRGLKAVISNGSIQRHIKFGWLLNFLIKQNYQRC